MLSQILAIARITFVESLRQPVFFVIVVLSAVLQVFNTLLSAYTMGYTEETEVFGDDKLLLDMGLATVLVCGTLLAAFVATSVLSREIDNKTALTVISKPVGRPLFVLGKYFGVSSAMSVAMVIMTVFFLLAIRHSVMSTARDTVDGPVLLFGLLAILGSIAVGVWGNFFYGWVFSSTTVGTMLPASVLAYVATLVVSKEWTFQSPLVDFKPQIMLAAMCVFLAMLVLSAIAIAASTRLSQVMTVTVCAGALLLGLLSNYLIGRYAYENQAIGKISGVQEPPGDTPDLSEAGARLSIVFDQAPDADLPPGTPVYYGPTPEGIGLVVPRQQPFKGDPTNINQVRDPALGRALVIAQAESENEHQFQLVNANGLPVERNPNPGDFVFLQPTNVNPAALLAWSVVPNLQFFWLIDPITQGHDIPPRYLGMVFVYTGVQVFGLVALSVLLFQRRDVG